MNSAPLTGMTRQNGPSWLRLYGGSSSLSGSLMSEVANATSAVPAYAMVRYPTIGSLANQLSNSEKLDESSISDAIVIGGGPSGLAAAVYGAAAGLSIVVIEEKTIGGQAGISFPIESYPRAIGDLQAIGKAQIKSASSHLVTQTPSLLLSHLAIGVYGTDTIHYVRLDGHPAILGRTVVIATGAKYCRLNLPNADRFDYRGLHYAATGFEAALCMDEEVVVVGGGDSGGRAAVFLSGIARHVHLLISGDSLDRNMSAYLTERISSSTHITLHMETEVINLEGDTVLREVTWQHRRSGVCVTRPIENLFVMTGAIPNTSWLRGQVDLDANGFVLTGPDLSSSRFATSCPGVFAVGDVRAGSLKRVAAAVKEGADVVEDVLAYVIRQAQALA